MPDRREHKICERAYAIWEAEGRPDGKDVEHWLRAEEEIAVEERAAAEKTELEADGVAAKEAKAKPPNDRRRK